MNKTAGQYFDNGGDDAVDDYNGGDEDGEDDAVDDDGGSEGSVSLALGINTYSLLRFIKRRHH